MTGKWWMAIPLGFAALFAAIMKGGKDSKPKTDLKYSVEDWIPIMRNLCEAVSLPLEFALQWIRMESGGNPCAWGTATAKGPDGHPREQGIGQLYNPDDFNRFDIPSGSFRVYCVPGTQRCSRLLTGSEMHAQAEATVKLITKCRERAGMTSAKAGITGWTGKDRWKLVKLVHGLPGLVVQGIPRVIKKLGRSPRDWQEFKVALNETKLDEGTERYRSIFPRILANAEKCASVLPDDVRIVS